MKNNKILYLFTIIITLFSFNTSVNAAQELTCLYGNGKDELTIAFIQEKDGIKYKQYALEIDKSNAGIEDKGWKKLTKSINDAFYSYPPSSAASYVEGAFNSCPGSIKNETAQYVVYNGSDTADFIINKNSNNERMTFYSANLIEYEDFSTANNEEILSGIPCNQLRPDEKWLQTSNNWDSSKYQMACLYQKDSGNQCHIIQLNVGKNQRTFIDSKQFTVSNYGVSVADNAFSVDMIKNHYQGQCPKYILVATSNSISYIDQTKSINTLTWSAFKLINNTGKNILTDETLTTNELIIKPTDEIKKCSDLFGEDDSILNIVRTIINLVKIFIPIVLIGLGIFDFAMAIFAGEEDKMKKAQKKFINRVIIAIIIFLVPSLLKMLLTLANSIWPNIDATLCGLI